MMNRNKDVSVYMYLIIMVTGYTSMILCHFYTLHTLVAGYYGITVAVSVSVLLSKTSVCLFRSVHPSIFSFLNANE